MTPAEVNAALARFALQFPESTEEFPWGDRVVKVNGKIFLFLGQPAADAPTFGLSVKLPQSASDVLEAGLGTPTPYGLGKHGWVSVRYSAALDLSLATLEAWVEESFRAVAPKRAIKAHDARGGRDA